MSKNDMVKIKICGLTRYEEAEYLNEAKADLAGFVFYEKSKRNVSFEKAAGIMKALDASITKVAVTVSPDEELIKRIENAGFDIIQIHGELGTDMLKIINIPVWRALNISDTDEAGSALKPYEGHTDIMENIKGIVMDAPDFGSGKTFDWHKSRRLLKAGDRSSPLYGRDLILAGGLNEQNVAEGIKLFGPDIVDVSSGVEGDDGKSHDKILAFVNAVRWQSETAIMKERME